MAGKSLRNPRAWPLVAAVVAMMVGAIGISAQSRPLQPSTAPGSAWTPARTLDGQPDLQGLWVNNTVTPFFRPKELADKPLLTSAEVEVLKTRAARLFGADADAETAPGDELFAALVTNPERFRADRTARPTGDTNYFWQAVPLVFENRTSQIIDPPNGLLPPLTSAGQRWQEERARSQREHPADGPEDRHSYERCIVQSPIKVGFVQSRANSYFQIVQTRQFVMIESEQIHEARIIALDRQSHLPPAIRLWLGDSIARWEGASLVIDTTNFHPQSVFRPIARGAFPSAQFHTIERLTPIDANTLQYQVTVDDRSTWTTPWTAATTWQRTNARSFEFACHEGNYSLGGILRGAREDERGAQK